MAIGVAAKYFSLEMAGTLHGWPNSDGGTPPPSPRPTPHNRIQRDRREGSTFTRPPIKDTVCPGNAPFNQALKDFRLAGSRHGETQAVQALAMFLVGVGLEQCSLEVPLWRHPNRRGRFGEDWRRWFWHRLDGGRGRWSPEDAASFVANSHGVDHAAAIRSVPHGANCRHNA